VIFLGKVRITFFGPLTQTTGEHNTDIEALTLKEAINTLTVKYGEPFKSRVYDEKGKLRKFVNIYINGKDVRFLNSLDTELNEGDGVSIIPAVGGG
jgi:MoaD family protein